MKRFECVDCALLGNILHRTSFVTIFISRRSKYFRISFERERVILKRIELQWMDWKHTPWKSFVDCGIW